MQEASKDSAGKVPESGKDSAGEVQEAGKDSAGKELKVNKESPGDNASPGDVLKVLIIHAQYFIIIMRLPVEYPPIMSKLTAFLSAVTGAESLVAFSYSCFSPGLDSDAHTTNPTDVCKMPTMEDPPKPWVGICICSEGVTPLRQETTQAEPKSALRHRIASGLLEFRPVKWFMRYLRNARRVLAKVDIDLHLRAQLSVLVIVAVFILYPGWAQTALSVFACSKIDTGTTEPQSAFRKAAWRHGYWVRDMAQECYTGLHLRLYVPIGIASVIVLCLGLPLASFLLIWYHKVELGLTSPIQTIDKQAQLRYSFLYARYKRCFYWWESVLMLEELALVAVEVFGRGLKSVTHQILVMIAAFTFIAAINTTCMPIKRKLKNIFRLEFLSMTVLSLTVSLSLFFVADEGMTLADKTVVAAIILALNVAVLGAFLKELLCSVWKYVEEFATWIKQWIPCLKCKGCQANRYDRCLYWGCWPEAETRSNGENPP
ncbi:hypothetical protein GPECTOR_150g36 [Gonium pectorale]|uniref:TRP C-terminal domain-containing protein n=1 Tax=Gonium pectorale TaxID=33097 RepID=A0A150FXU3_GONPE|nr:hypothetical protein GPECTOR_150g36 [Gonium pectorale]|eukprot:KXZ42408.1 hypothetical protein GPECTOR_150g36 [Gonium pectorale]